MRSTPPWMVSMLLHTGLLIALALLAVPVDTLDFVEIVARQGDEVGDRLLNDTVEIPVYDATAAAQEFAVDVNLVHNPLAARRELEIELEEFEPELQADGPTIGRALSGRQKGARRALLAAYGGTGETESAVQRGLEWLQRHQARDGSWSLEGPYPNGGVFENTPAATAMALLAFLGAGHTHQEGEFREVVARGAKALVKLQDNEGSVIRHVAVENHRLYTQAQATIALCELYGMTRDEAFRQPAQRALDYAARSQAEDDAGGGGWRYLPRQYIDTSVTGWFVMALQSGKMAGLQVSEPALLKVGVYLDSVTSDGTHYRYMPDYPPSVVMTAEALLCRQYLGWERDDPRLTAGARHLLEHPIDWSERNVYYWYYATQMLHHMGGDDWDRWNRRLRVEVPKGQEQAGRQRGSWSPLGDEHGSDAGRLYTTCFCLYMLEVYYRHLPIYRHEGL